MRFRNIFLAVGSAIVLAAMLMTDPDNGLLTGFWALKIAQGVVAVAFAHFARKALMDYPEADMRRLFNTARGDATGAGLALVAQAIVIFGLLMLFGGNARAEPPLPKGAYTYIPVLKAEVDKFWPDHPLRPVLAGQVHKETCITDQHRFCWSPKAQLKTAREEGAGMGQLTRTWRPDGSIRFDALAELRDRHPATLGALSWATIYDRPDLQLRALVIKAHDDYREFAQVRSIMNRLLFQVAAYNRGVGGIQAERRLCQAKPGCDPQQWWENVEANCTASRAPLYGQMSACDINRHYVMRVHEGLAPRYRYVI